MEDFSFLGGNSGATNENFDGSDGISLENKELAEDPFDLYGESSINDSNPFQPNEEEENIFQSNDFLDNNNGNNDNLPLDFDSIPNSNSTETLSSLLPSNEGNNNLNNNNSLLSPSSSFNSNHQENSFGNESKFKNGNHFSSFSKGEETNSNSLGFSTNQQSLNAPNNSIIVPFGGQQYNSFINQQSHSQQNNPLIQNKEFGGGNQMNSIPMHSTNTVNGTAMNQSHSLPVGYPNSLGSQQFNNSLSSGGDPHLSSLSQAQQAVYMAQKQAMLNRQQKPPEWDSCTF
eukprot:TRINITY_DN3585_c0_g1_i1.p1 TRINITY_DN3585_c0_g1~~TRINITY_DN3585_c0_g1_i1.p1  ORF type:complete len:287 (-),score=138.96 TRINITY_DN3585_c0_g1_i1:72-932(-)